MVALAGFEIQCGQGVYRRWYFQMDKLKAWGPFLPNEASIWYGWKRKTWEQCWAITMTSEMRKLLYRTMLKAEDTERFFSPNFTASWITLKGLETLEVLLSCIHKLYLSEVASNPQSRPGIGINRLDQEIFSKSKRLWESIQRRFKGWQGDWGCCEEIQISQESFSNIFHINYIFFLPDFALK